MELTDINGVPYFNGDVDLQKIFDWFMTFIHPAEWSKRKKAIEMKIAWQFENPMTRGKSMSEMVVFSNNDDTIGWYLYLVEKLLTDPSQYEVVQGARVIPVFKRMGADFEYLIKVKGLEEKVKHLVKKGRSEADAIMFEMLVGLAWRRNGWNVSFIPETTESKTPDLLAERSGELFYVECKRLKKSSDYSQREREKWLKMFTYINSDLLRHSAILDINFHIPLEELPDDFLEKKLTIKIDLATQPMVLISNDTWDVSIDFVNYAKVNEHLSKLVVKYPSPQFCYLIAGKKVNANGFTYGAEATFQKRGNGTGNGQYVDRLSKAYGVNWKCDAEEAISAKARDIRKQLIDACKQFPDNENAVVHVGLETLDGGEVEDARLYKIFNTVNFFDRKEKGLEFIYCHLFQSYAPPTETWVFDETVSSFIEDGKEENAPLENPFLVLPANIESTSGVHWHKPIP